METLDLTEIKEESRSGYSASTIREEISAFTKEHPALLLAFTLFTLLLTSGDLIEVIPYAKPWMDTALFSYFHNTHDVLAISVGIFVAYRYSAAVGQMLILFFFSAHIPYFILTYPHDGPMHLSILLKAILGLGGTVLIGRLHRTVLKAEHSARLSQYLAGHDTLSHLPNRSLFNELLRQSIGNHKRKNKNLAVLYIDLDHFKDINESLGHPTGDHALRVIAKRLSDTIREGDSLARITGDEFAIIANELDAEENAAFLANRIIKNINEPFRVDGHELFLSPSIGIASYSPSEQSDTERISDHLQMLRWAEIAMYRAKENGRNTFAFYNQDMSVEISTKLEVLNDLRYAVERNQLVLYYQPQIDLSTGNIVGTEALIRWNHHLRGMVPPMEFIPAAETSGQIVKIGEWVIKTACKQNQKWQSYGLPNLKVGVNISAMQLKLQLVDTVSMILKHTGLNAKYLDIELTESALMEDVNMAIRVIGELKRLGVSLSIDDFGTGYSSLSRLTEFNLDTLKIDRCFVSGMTGEENNAIAEAVIKLGHSLKIDVLAEGVETEDELIYLKSLGCDMAQGYYYSKPVPAEEFAEKLAKS